MTPDQLFSHYDQLTDAQLLAETTEWSGLISDAQLCLAAIWGVRHERADAQKDTV